MEKINWTRVVLGGMLAGVVLIALTTAATALLLGQQALRTAMQALRPSTGGGVAPLFFTFVFLLLGVFMTWSYAAIRPRFGPGPKTAAIAGLALWLTVIWMGTVGFVLKSMVMGEPYSLPSGPMLPCLYLLMIIAGTLVGASVYQEQS